MRYDCCGRQMDFGPNPYVTNVASMAMDNSNFRTAIWTGNRPNTPEEPYITPRLRPRWENTRCTVDGRKGEICFIKCDKDVQAHS